MGDPAQARNREAGSIAPKIVRPGGREGTLTFTERTWIPQEGDPQEKTLEGLDDPVGGGGRLSLVLTEQSERARKRREKRGDDPKLL